MASSRLEKYRKNKEISNDVNNNDVGQTPQELIRDWFKCICYRPSTYIVCRNATCGFRAYGRVRKLCRTHPKVTYLLDLPMCPHCHAGVIEINPTVNLNDR